jgi:GxxExxY protein
LTNDANIDMGTNIIEKESSFQIINAAYEDHNGLGPGFLEAIYEAAMVLELEAREYKVETQVRVPVYYREQMIAEHVLDVLVDERVIFELKAVKEIAPIRQQQALSYLKAMGLELAIVINFGAPSVKYMRIVNTNKKKFA